MTLFALFSPQCSLGNWAFGKLGFWDLFPIWRRRVLVAVVKVSVFNQSRYNIEICGM